MSPDGRDTGDGSLARPFATLARAQAEVRRLKSGAGDDGPITVELAAGTYRLTAPLVFSAEDSGRPGAPITYTAAPGAVVRLVGSVALQPTWTPIVAFPGFNWDRVALNLHFGDATEDAEISGPGTPAAAQFRARRDVGSLWTFGRKGPF